MADDRSRKLTGAVPVAGGPPTSSGQIARDPRAAVAVPVRFRYQSFVDFVDTQSMNVSRSGMFIASKTQVPIGTAIDFEFTLADGFALLRGKAEVVRISSTPPGIGVRFNQLDEPSRKLIDRIVEINVEEGKRPTIALDFAEAAPRGTNPRGQTAISPGVEFNGRDLHIEINPGTAPYFTNN